LEQKIKILIAEDDLISAEYLKTILIKAGYDIIGICTKGQEAIDVGIHQKPDVILMDVMLKDNISGCDAAKYLLNIVDSKIIFISAYSDPEMIDCAIEAKGYKYIIKPYKDEQILTTIQMATYSSNSSQASSSIVKLVGNYSYNKDTKELLYFDNPIKLKQNKLKLIDILAIRPNSAVSYEQISENIFNSQVKTGALRTLVSRLNRELNIKIIKNVSSVGYKLNTLD